MKAKFIALATAAAIATAGMAPAPVQADQARDLAGLLIGITAIATIADAARKNQNAQTEAARENNRNRVYYKSTTTYRDRDDHKHRNNRWNRDRDEYRGRPASLPRKCEFSRYTRSGWATYYGPRCMERQGWEKHGNAWVKVRAAYR